MNPDGMIALLNYREDGITRQYHRLLHNRNLFDLGSIQLISLSGKMASRKSNSESFFICICSLWFPC